MGYSLLPYLPLVVKHDEKYRLQLRRATPSAARPPRHQPRPHQPLQREPPQPLKAWANALGLKLRVQPYGLQTDAMQASALLDIPEGESLGFKNLDDYRRSGRRARHARAHDPVQRGAAPPPAAPTARRGRPSCASSRRASPAGVNQKVFHGFSYADAPGVPWPGFAAFSPYTTALGYGEAWGPRSPHVAAHARHRGRTSPAPSSSCRPGTPKDDVGLPAAEGLDVHGHRRLLGDERRHPARLEATASSPRRCSARPPPRLPATAGSPPTDRRTGR